MSILALGRVGHDGSVGTRAVGAVVGSVLLVTGCSSGSEEPEPRAERTAESTPSGTPRPTPSPTPSPTPAPTDELPPVTDRVSLAALMREDFTGGRIRVLREQLANEAYTRSEVTYPSGDVTVSGVLLRPRGKGPFPAVVLN